MLEESLLWTIWIDYNNKIFKLQGLGDHKVMYLTLQGMIDYARIEWSRTLDLINEITKEAKEEFFFFFGLSSIPSGGGPFRFFSHNGFKIRWCY
jgi:hypothetical protein